MSMQKVIENFLILIIKTIENKITTIVMEFSSQFVYNVTYASIKIIGDM